MDIRYRVSGEGFELEVQGASHKADAIVSAIMGSTLGVDDTITIARITLKPRGPVPF